MSRQVRMTLEEARAAGILRTDPKKVMPGRRRKSVVDHRLDWLAMVKDLERALGIEYRGVASKHTVAKPRQAWAEWWFAVEVDRDFRADWAIPWERLGVEIDGGRYVRRPDGSVGGAHHTGAGRARDMEKMRVAAEVGWIIGEFEWEEVRAGAVTAWALTIRKERRVGR